MVNSKNFHFEKVSFEEYSKERVKLFGERYDEHLREEYNNVQLPRRATSGSAGYDFFCPFPINNIGDNCTFGNSGLNMKRKEVTIPTGIRWISDDDSLVLLLMPRSGLGFKYGMALSNTIGVIDSDYYHSDNEGHIMAKIYSSKEFSLGEGQAFMQGIVVPFCISDKEDKVSSVRNGGFGSTDSERAQ